MTESKSKSPRDSIWPGMERRSVLKHDSVGTPSATEKDLATKIEQYIDTRMTEMSNDHRAYFEKRFDEVVTLIKDGFPDGDTRGHREMHKALIDDAKTRKDRRESVIKQVLTGSVWATILFLGGAAWLAIKNEVKK